MTTILRVLYIEDDEGVAQLLRLQLESLGWIVALARDGATALTLCQNEKFDVILIDYSLPDFNGNEVLNQLYQIYEVIPVTIMVTGTGDEQIAVDAMKSGADDYIVKDVEGNYLSLLPQVIDRALERHEFRQREKQLLQEQGQLIEELRAFSYAAAHDLKQPLTVLSTSSQLLEHYIGNQNLDRAKRKLDQMAKTIFEMSETIDALILFARVRETATVEFEHINMTDLVNKVREQLADAIAASNAVITIPESLPSALGYAPWVERIWVNYLTNALKYGGNPPGIEIGAIQQHNNKVTYWIKDNGEGLTSSEQAQLFIPFSRLKEHIQEGHGLGLAIVRLIARRLGGEAEVLSTKGEGSIFTFTLNTPDASLAADV